MSFARCAIRGLFAVALAESMLTGQTAPLRHTHLHTLVSGKVVDNVNRNDLRAAMKVWFDSMARQKGFELDSDVYIASGVADIRARLESRLVDVLVLTIPDYLELESSRLVIPELTHGSVRGPAAFSYVLVVNPASKVGTLSGLRGKNLLTYSRTGAKTASVWIDVELSKERLGRAVNFFGSASSTATGQSCILPVYFGRSDACVVDQINLDLAQEMNPQLKQLRVIARSRPMIDGIVATPVDPHPYHRELIDTLLTLHQDTRGRQLLLVFKTERLVPIGPGDLESSREMFRDYKNLPAEPHSPAASAQGAVPEKE
jgi:ABC-type phosphate/phosphonate transport system substrate-binding protein